MEDWRLTNQHSFHEGYTTDDGYYWICKQCYKDFRKEFKWPQINKL